MSAKSFHCPDTDRQMIDAIREMLGLEPLFDVRRRTEFERFAYVPSHLPYARPTSKVGSSTPVG